MLQLDVSRLIWTAFWTVHAEQSNSVFCRMLSIGDRHWILTATELAIWVHAGRAAREHGRVLESNFSLCPLLLVNQKITFLKAHNLDKCWNGLCQHPCWAQMGQWDGTGSSLYSLCGSWAQHAKCAVHKNQQPWLSLIFQCAVSSERWEVPVMWLTKLPSQFWGKKCLSRGELQSYCSLAHANSWKMREW